MNRFKILVVDDEPGMRLGIERTLRTYRCHFPEFNEEVAFEINICQDGASALKILNEMTPDILLLDHKLPDMSGLDILIKLNSEKKLPLTIMITAFASLDVAISATKNGAFDFLAKPFTPEEIRDRILKASKHLYLQRKAAALAEEKKQVRFQFISVLAHELKSPLAAIEGYLRMMEDQIAGEQVNAYLGMVNRSLDRINGMRKLIMDLTDLTRIESGKRSRQIQKIDLKAIAERAIEGVSNDAIKKEVQISFDCQNVDFIGDPDELEIIFNNLLTNAVKYNRQGGTVALQITPVDNEVIISCQDTGIGMTPEECQRLFGEFVRIKNDKTRDIPGSGLGLSILKKLVHLYQGNIEVRSRPEVGTSFVVNLKTCS